MGASLFSLGIMGSMNDAHGFALGALNVKMLPYPAVVPPSICRA